MRFLFEIYQNAYDHGQNLQDSRGIRYIQLRRHIGTRDALLAASNNVPSLQNYISRMARKSGEYRFIELSVGDSGPGILKTYLAAIQAHRYDKLECAELMDLLKQILLTPLTRKFGVRGAGLGIPNAIDAARYLSAYVSLRTDQFWVYSSFDPDSRYKSGIESISEYPAEVEISAIHGTHFSIVIPSPI